MPRTAPTLSQLIARDDRYHTAKFEVRRRIEEELREEGVITSSCVESIVTIVEQNFRLRPTSALTDYAYVVAGVCDDEPALGHYGPSHEDEPKDHAYNELDREDAGLVRHE